MQSQLQPAPFRGAFAQVLPANLPQPLFDTLMKVLQVEETDGLYQRLTQGDRSTFLARLLDSLHVELKASAADLAQIPRSGPVVAVSNHPFGIVEGVALAHLLPTIRPDIKIMANSMLRGFRELEGSIICVDPFGGAAAKRSNMRGLREAIDWLDSGGMLLIFPAGEVSQFQFPKFQVQDPVWSDSIARLLRLTKASAVPLFIDGRNSVLFHLAGMLHPRFRTALLPHELMNKQRSVIELRCGAAIPSARLHAFASDRKLVEHLRWRTYLLGKRDRPRRPIVARGKAIAAPEPVTLPLCKPLLEAGEFQVFCAAGHEMPGVLREIGRLREETFRQAGEGTGKARDLDAFDNYYHHLFLWNKEKGEIAGAYRLGLVDAIVKEHGVKGLYTHTLFDFDQRLLDKLGPAVELGRSFVPAKYQRSFQPLLLLWKGIGQFVLRNAPAYTLFGPVSISGDYTRTSRELIASILSSHQIGLPNLVRPRKPLKQRFAISPSCDLEELGDLISDLEPDRKSIPVLLRQYLKLGGRLLAFNVDPKFNHCLDGLIVVDLAQTDKKLLDRYMGAEGARRFLDQNRKRRLDLLDAAVDSSIDPSVKGVSLDGLASGFPN